MKPWEDPNKMTFLRNIIFRQRVRTGIGDAQVTRSEEIEWPDLNIPKERIQFSNLTTVVAPDEPGAVDLILTIGVIDPEVLAWRDQRRAAAQADAFEAYTDEEDE